MVRVEPQWDDLNPWPLNAADFNDAADAVSTRLQRERVDRGVDRDGSLRVELDRMRAAFNCTKELAVEAIAEQLEAYTAALMSKSLKCSNYKRLLWASEYLRLKHPWKRMDVRMHIAAATYSMTTEKLVDFAQYMVARQD